jgi:hypothetical protein
MAHAEGSLLHIQDGTLRRWQGVAHALVKAGGKIILLERLVYLLPVGQWSCSQLSGGLGCWQGVALP